MRVGKGLMALLTATVISLPAQAQAESLTDAVTAALRLHPGVHVKQAASDAAEKSITEERSNYMPTISVEAGTGPSYDDNDTTRGLTGGDDGVHSVQFTGRAAMNQMLYDFNRTQSRVTAAELRKTAADKDLENTREQLAMEATTAYFEVLRTREQTVLAQNYRKILNFYLDKIRMRAEAGAGDSVQLAEAEERIAVAESSLLRFERDAMNATNKYREIIGRAPDSRMDAVKISDGILPKNLDMAVAIGLKENPQIVSAGNQALSRDWDMRAEKANLAPRLDAELTYTQNELANNAGGQAINAQALVKMTWDFTVGGGKTARVDRAAALRLQAESERLSLMREVERSIRDSWVDLKIARQELALLRERELKNKDILVRYNQQYEAGKRSFLQIVGVETRLFNSQAEAINGRYKLLRAKSQLLAKMGRLRNTLNVQTQVAQNP